MANIFVTIAICTWNRAESLRATLTSLRDMDDTSDIEWEVLIINNNCTDNTEDVVADFVYSLPIRSLTETQQGLSLARNHAAAAARGTYILWTDDDAVVGTRWLKAYADAFKAWPDAAVFGGPILPQFVGQPPYWLEHALRESNIGGVYALRNLGGEPIALEIATNGIPYGANYAVRLQEQRQFPYDPRLGPHGTDNIRGDEVDVITRILGSGAAGRWVPLAIVYHSIPKDRQTQAYIRDWFVGHGRTEVLRKGPANDARSFMGAPRWLWRRAITSELSFRLKRIFCSPGTWCRELANASNCWGKSQSIGKSPVHDLEIFMSRVLVVSLDGYERSIEEEMIQAGRLPALARIRDRSARFLLEHGSALRTGLGAEHVSSGMSPESGKRWSSLAFDKSSYEVVQEGPKFRPFPAEMSSTTVVFDLPYFDLTRAPNVQGVSAWGAHDAGTELLSNPAGLAAELVQKFGGYPAENSMYAIVWPSEDKCRLVGSELVLGVERRAEIATWLLKERFPEWDLALIGVSEAHSVLEALWHGYDTQHPLHHHRSGPAARLGVLNVYEAIDQLVDRLASEFDDTEIVIFSMHGMGPNKSDVPSMVLLPELIHRHEFGEPFFEQPSSWTNAVDGIPLLGEAEHWHVETKQIEERKSASARIGRFVPGRLRNNLKGVLRAEGGPALSERKRSVQWMPAARYRRVWPRMRAFALPSYYDGRVRINLKGRERNGLVPLDRYEGVYAEIADLVSNCRDPISGRSVVDSIEYGHKGRALRLDASAADITIVWQGTPLAFEHPTLGKIGPVPFRRVGGHTGPFGMAYIAGDRITAGDRGKRSSFDVVPTLFDLLDEPVPQRISGRSLLEA